MGFVDECDPTSENQIFDLVESTSNAGNYEFHIGDGFCVVVGSTSHRPGAMAPPMVMARDLFLSECDSVPSELRLGQYFQKTMDLMKRLLSMMRRRWFLKTRITLQTKPPHQLHLRCERAVD